MGLHARTSRRQREGGGEEEEQQKRRDDGGVVLVAPVGSWAILATVPGVVGSSCWRGK